MINVMDKTLSIGEVVAELPNANRVFAEYGIDFCCGGHRKLYDVIQEQKLDETNIYEALKNVQEERINSYQGENFGDMSATALTDYIEDTHHSYTRKALPEIAELLNTIARVHGKNHEELFEVYRLFGMLKSDLEQHLIKEETILFPDFENEEVNKAEIQRVSDEIIQEHEAAGEILTKLRTITNQFRAPEDGCGTYRLVYQLLEELETDLHQHIHLENNILLKEYDKR
ncbi:iron-sulfur cluster repair di-iron protein [Lachnospiraceae bacterium MD1]|uniref:Iron-sulfur cluster repair di-iron protein n=1 Tax=Variimorphobacter saccharofermentans TaxID=2755051 RepID=A0A839K0H6_9FIRM|nr:iron-sulfur cluster repair di-iron protein [Variimorphobacter saccharofermentans]MBB2183160.1 iron-sulfur cluster repair di-iron protein [Variimorphobacter saccharofermentans]